MSTSRRPRTPRTPGTPRHGVRIAAAITLTATALVAMNVHQPATASIVPTVPLATSANYSVLGAETVTNTGPSVLGQSVGVSPGTAITGFPPGSAATIEAATPAAAQAQLDLTAAYDNAAGRGVEFTQTNPDLVGQTLVPGVYAATAKAPLGLSGQLVLDGQGNPDAVFIFQTDSTLITGSGSTILMVNGASECNVFWQVGSSATIATGSFFVGNILALTSIAVQSGAVVHGRALARTGEVTLDNNVFTQPSCAPSVDTVPTSAPVETTTAPGETTPGTAPGDTVPGDTTPATVPVLTLPQTGTPAETTTNVALAALLLGLGALLLARRRTT